MNIFVLDSHPETAAQMQCDRHVVKMVLETAQMLCTVINEMGGSAPYKSTHVNHPCSVWARKSLGNFLWLYDHGMALAKEYTTRYGKVHKAEAVIQECMFLSYQQEFPDPGPEDPCGLDVTPFALCMPDEYKSDNVVESYRRFYIGEKAGFARWNKTRSAPQWWQQSTPENDDGKKGKQVQTR